MKTPFVLISRAENTLYIDHYAPETPSSGAILYIHGFKGFKDWGFVPYLAEHFARLGFHFFTFNFSHNGVEDDFLNFTAPEKFKHNTFSLEISEATEMIDRIKAGSDFGLEPMDKIGVIGHSRGGGVALVAGCHHPDVDAICTLASISTFDRYPPELRKLWREQGYIEVANARTNQVFQMGLEMLNDIEANVEESLSIEKAVAGYAGPLCIIHGNQDEAVTVDEAELIYDWVQMDTVEMHILPETGHTFGVVHPFAGTTPAFDLVLTLTEMFFERLS